VDKPVSPLCRITLVETQVGPARRVEISSILTCKQWAKS